MENRISGYYHTRDGRDWAISFWARPFKFWLTISDEAHYQDSDFDEIDERRIEREPEQIVKVEEIEGFDFYCADCQTGFNDGFCPKCNP